WMLHKLLRMSDEDIRKAEKRFEKYGKLAMLLAWVPVIGDPLTVVAGLFRMNFYWFVLLVGAGKLVRYWVLIWGTLALLR
ncbi:MAG: DedA family protein, partial [Calditrichaeota bacterium]|nr:DedA family protein [Calditrichota bacterium]